MTTARQKRASLSRYRAKFSRALKKEEARNLARIALLTKDEGEPSEVIDDNKIFLSQRGEEE